VAVTITYNHPFVGPEMLLRVFRVRPNNTDFFSCAQFGDYDEAKRQLANGEASVLDVNEQNSTALSVRPSLFLIRR